jgi:PKHD-type hydroxylase
MLLSIPLLDTVTVGRFREQLLRAPWGDGTATAGYQSSRVKRNRQLLESLPEARALGDEIIDRLTANLLFMSAALPAKIFPPLFNRYEGGEHFGTHVDNPIRPVAGTPHRVRTDLSATLFLSEPGDYEGGALVIEDTFGPREVRLPAGELLLYPGTSLHHVTPVTRGTRLAAFFWVQSMVREDSQRSLLFDLDMNLQQLRRTLGDDNPQLVGLTGVYHNLVRRWADI